MAYVVKQLPEPDNEAIVCGDNAKVELLHWHWQLNCLIFESSRLLPLIEFCQRDGECKGAQICVMYF